MSKNNHLHKHSHPSFQNNAPSQPSLWQWPWGNSPISLTISSWHWCHSSSSMNRGYVHANSNVKWRGWCFTRWLQTCHSRESNCLKNLALAPIIVISWTGSTGPMELGLSTRRKMAGMWSSNHTGQTQRQWEPQASSEAAMTCSDKQHVWSKSRGKKSTYQTVKGIR